MLRTQSGWGRIKRKKLGGKRLENDKNRKCKEKAELFNWWRVFVLLREKSSL